MVDGLARVVGIDCGEDWHVAVLIDEAGQEVLCLDIPNRRDRIEEGLAQLLMAIPEGALLQVAVESERSHGRLVGDVARGMGGEIWQVNTIALNHFRDVEGQPRKDDRRDAYLLARMVFLRNKGCRPAVEVMEGERVLQRLSRLYKRVGAKRTRAILQLQSLLLELAPEVLHKDWEGPAVDSKAMVYLLERWPGFVGMERSQLSSIVKILRKCRYGAGREDVARRLREMAKRIQMPAGERGVVTMEIQHLIAVIRSCDATQAKVKKEIDAAVAAHPVGQRLLEMPGVGSLTAAVLISELLPVVRVATEAQSATYAGVTPLSRKSGKMKEHQRLARGVNKHILRCLYLSSVASLRCSALDRAYYQKKLRGYEGHPKPHVAACIALARQRHKVIYKILTEGACYDKEVLISSHLEREEPSREKVA